MLTRVLKKLQILIFISKDLRNNLFINNIITIKEIGKISYMLSVAIIIMASV